MKKQHKKILFLSPYPLGTAPSQRLKYEQYYSAIEQAGYQITTSSFVSISFWKIIYSPGNFVKKIVYTLIGYINRWVDLLSIRKYDVVYIHLWVTPLGFPLLEYLFCRLAKRVIYDIDDMIYLQQDNRRWIDKLKGRKKPIVLMQYANHVIVCSPYLAEFVASYTSNITTILATYDTQRASPIKQHLPKDVITIGWTGTHSTLKYLDIVLPVLEEISQVRAIELLVICNSPYYPQQIPVRNIIWSAEQELNDLRQIDIGIYPLSKEKWVLGKSGNKALAYMNLGIPCVATNFGTNTLVIQHGENGFLADSLEEWKHYLLLLIDDVYLRTQIGQNARVSVEEHYSVMVNSKKYLAVLNS